MDTLQNKIDGYLSDTIIKHDNFDEWWEEIKKTGYVGKSEAKTYWIDFLQDQYYDYAEGQ